MPWESAMEQYPEHVHAIGMVSIENANLEIALADMVAAALMISKGVAHAIYFAPRAAMLRIDIAQAAIEERFKRGPKRRADSILEKQKSAALPKMQRLLKRSRAVIQRRHDVIHDAWGVDRSATGETVLRQKIGETLRHTATQADLLALKSLVSDFRMLIDEIQTLTGNLRAKPPLMVDLKIS